MKKLFNSIFPQSLLVGILLLSSSTMSWAQEAEGAEVTKAEPGFWDAMMTMDARLLIMLGIVMMLLIIILIMMGFMVYMLNYILNGETDKDSAVAVAKEAKPSMLAVWYEKLVSGKLYEGEQERAMILDHDYDGIREMNYGMPPWLTTFFVVTIGFGIIYLINMYALGTVPHQADEYEEEMAMAVKQQEERNKKLANLIDENTVTLNTDAALLAEGQEIYLANCRACHGAEGQGGVGPNLTDKYWKHGGSINDVFKVVKYGVPDKGMISWSNKLNPPKINAVSNYIMTLVGTNPSNPKAPEGEEYIPVEDNKSVATN